MRILYLTHNDPRFHPGGTEIFAQELFEEVGARSGVQALFVAATSDLQRPRSPGTPFQTVGRSANEMLLWTGAFDRFNLSQVDTHGVLPELERLIREFKPDVVHAHHVLLIGLEAFAVVRRAAPKARIVLTLHDYYPICHRDGVMVRTLASGTPFALCDEATPDRCARCFPDASRMDFKLRELYVRRHLDLVDRFVAPSRFLAARYADWGLDAARISVVRNGRRLTAPAPLRPAGERTAEPAFAVFGNVSPLKGTLLAVGAARIAATRTNRRFTLTVHGAPLFQEDAFVQQLNEAVDAANAAGAARVLLAGSYRPGDVPARMAAADWVVVPSVWWENAPLVIDEAFHHGRPVICSDIGGMAEAVTDGVNGVHVRAGDILALANRMVAVIESDGVWEELRQGLPSSRSIQECADEHKALYQKSGSRRRAANAGVQAVCEETAA
ncbi:glycosyltransferase family 4 protein [Azospirillum sp. sgz301742]